MVFHRVFIIVPTQQEREDSVGDALVLTVLYHMLNFYRPIHHIFDHWLVACTSLLAAAA